MATTYAPPASPDQLPRTHAEWRRRTGLTDPGIIASIVRMRSLDVVTLDTDDPGPSYADFFHAR